MPNQIELKLKNGLTCVFIEGESKPQWLPTLLAGLVVGGGAGDDPAGKKGLAHVTEHLIGRSPLEHRNFYPKMLARAYDERRIVMPQPRTELDYTIYSWAIPAEFYAELFEYFTKMFSSLPMNESMVERCIREVVKEKDEKEEDNPFGLAYDALYRSMFPGKDGYSWYTVGRYAQVKNITLDDIMNFVDSHYDPSNLTLVCMTEGKPSGIPFEKMVEAAKRTLELWPRRKPAPEARETSEHRKKGLRLRSLPQKEKRPGLLIGFNGSSDVEHPQWLGHVLNNLLVGPGSAFQKEAMEHLEALAGFNPILKNSNVYEILIQPKDGALQTIEKLLCLLRDSVTKVLSGQFTDREFDIARALTVREWQKRMEIPVKSVDDLAVHRRFVGDCRDWFNWDEFVGELEKEKLIAYARATLQWENAVIVLPSTLSGNSGPRISREVRLRIQNLFQPRPQDNREVG